MMQNSLLQGSLPKEVLIAGGWSLPVAVGKGNVLLVLKSGPGAYPLRPNTCKTQSAFGNNKCVPGLDFNACSASPLPTASKVSSSNNLSSSALALPRSLELSVSGELCKKQTVTCTPYLTFNVSCNTQICNGKFT